MTAETVHDGFSAREHTLVLDFRWRCLKSPPDHGPLGGSRSGIFSKNKHKSCCFNVAVSRFREYLQQSGIRENGNVIFLKNV